MLSLFVGMPAGEHSSLICALRSYLDITTRLCESYLTCFIPAIESASEAQVLPSTGQGGVYVHEPRSSLRNASVRSSQLLPAGLPMCHSHRPSLRKSLHHGSITWGRVRRTKISITTGACQIWYSL